MFLQSRRSVKCWQRNVCICSFGVGYGDVGEIYISVDQKDWRLLRSLWQTFWSLSCYCQLSGYIYYAIGLRFGSMYVFYMTGCPYRDVLTIFVTANISGRSWGRCLEWSYVHDCCGHSMVSYTSPKCWWMVINLKQYAEWLAPPQNQNELTRTRTRFAAMGRQRLTWRDLLSIKKIHHSTVGTFITHHDKTEIRNCTKYL
jgi:hypothetical protein